MLSDREKQAIMYAVNTLTDKYVGKSYKRDVINNKELREETADVLFELLKKELK